MSRRFVPWIVGLIVLAVVFEFFVRHVHIYGYVGGRDLVAGENRATLASQSLASTQQTPSPSVTIKATDWLNRLITGDWDWSQFGNGPDDVPKTAIIRSAVVQGFRHILAPCGRVKSMTYFSETSYLSDEGYHRTSYDYRVALTHCNIAYTFAMDSDRFVGGLAVVTNTRTFSYSR